MVVESRRSPADYQSGRDYRDYEVTEAVDGPLVTSGKAARLFGVTGETVVNWAKDGLLPYRRGNQPERKRWLIPQWAVDGRLVYLLGGGVDVGTDASDPAEPSGPVAGPDVPPAAPSDRPASGPEGHTQTAASREPLVEDNIRLRAFNDSLLDRLVEESAGAVATVSAVAQQLRRQHETLETVVRRLRQVDAQVAPVLPADIVAALNEGPESSDGN